MLILLIFFLIGTTTMQAQEKPKILSFQKIHSWIKKWEREEENEFILGILATVDKDNVPYTRTVAIREVSENGVLFFTQKGSKKVAHIKNNNIVSLTILLPNNTRQMTFRGQAKPLSNEENNMIPRYLRSNEICTQCKEKAKGRNFKYSLEKLEL